MVQHFYSTTNMVLKKVMSRDNKACLLLKRREYAKECALKVCFNLKENGLNCFKRIVWAIVVKGCPKLGLSWGKALVLSQQKSHKP